MPGGIPEKGAWGSPFRGTVGSKNRPSLRMRNCGERRTMRHSYIDRPRRLPAPRAGRLRRTRFAPVALALPLVTLMWLTIGLPIFAEVSVAGGGDGRARDVAFGAEIANRGSGGGNGGRNAKRRGRHSGGGNREAPNRARDQAHPRAGADQRLRGDRLSHGSGGKDHGRGAVSGTDPAHSSPVNPNHHSSEHLRDGSSRAAASSSASPASASSASAASSASSAASSASCDRASPSASRLVLRHRLAHPHPRLRLPDRLLHLHRHLRLHLRLLRGRRLLDRRRLLHPHRP